MQIDINCDMGEGLPDDELLMPYISSANIACGYHAGDASVMEQTVQLALRYRVAIGAHPGFDDRPNFGRTEIHLSYHEIAALITKQVTALQSVAERNGTIVSHVKPHGALYNMSAKDASIAAAIAEAVYRIDPRLVLFGLSGSHSITEAKKAGLSTASEVFADRSYQDDGSLTPRARPGALISTTEVAVRQVLQMVRNQTVVSLSGKTIAVEAQTICIHGDGGHAVEFARSIYEALK